jgi:hypothetical protein
VQLFRVSRSIYGGSDVIIGANYDLLVWFVVAGAMIIVAHALYKAFTKTNTHARH